MRRAPCPEVVCEIVLGRQWNGTQIEHIPLSEVTWVHWRGRRRRGASSAAAGGSVAIAGPAAAGPYVVVIIDEEKSDRPGHSYDSDAATNVRVHQECWRLSLRPFIENKNARVIIYCDGKARLTRHSIGAVLADQQVYIAYFEYWLRALWWSGTRMVQMCMQARTKTSMNHAERSAKPTSRTALFGKYGILVSSRCCRA
jgi:hypothetical protein